VKKFFHLKYLINSLMIETNKLEIADFDILGRVVAK
jgi:hypothetical protein